MSAFKITCILLATIVWVGPAMAQEELKPRQPPSREVLTEKKWKQVDESVGQGLKWLAKQQQNDGAFDSHERGQPGVTSLCVMAFLAQGESPSNGKYELQLTQAIDFIADQQKPNGLIATVAPHATPIPRDEESADGPQPKHAPNYVTVTAVYNHAISSLALCEAYGQCNAKQAKKLTPVIEKAIAATLEMQRWDGKKKKDVGGWRYLTKRFGNNSDLSVTGWQLMFLRSAKDAGFDVPKASIDDAVKFVKKCFLKDEDRQVYGYWPKKRGTITRAMAGAGILALAHAGMHDSKESVASGEWILKHDFKAYDEEKMLHKVGWLGNRYHYGAFFCTQGTYQLGGKYWEQFFPPLADTLLENQETDGSWLTKGRDRPWGGCYTTSLCILSLSVPDQMLPIFQR